ncbi:MAG: ribonuclease P protein component [Saprospiraceae bacterium]|nr:ribonuclease P protein component [Candidatus Brachybacter algidus]MBK8748176.1 ribonuclease P protein component [Candidatus Brachybacter algidus]MBL0119946.1 ribonuclease P protein component [Candidatus Brachybacter algidus]MBP7306538.1 ribonuclease P protein component [Saprospiraceae bacterium]
MKRTFALPRDNKLKSIVTISELFNEGKSQFTYPIKMVYSVQPSSGRLLSFKVAVSVPKKLFKKAVDRNTLKRRLRESVRLNQASLNEICQSANISLDFMLIFVGKEMTDYQQIDKAVRSLFEKLTRNVQ